MRPTQRRHESFDAGSGGRLAQEVHPRREGHLVSWYATALLFVRRGPVLVARGVLERIVEYAGTTRTAREPPAMSRRDGRVERSCIESTFAPIRFGLTRIRGSHLCIPPLSLRARDSCCCFRRRRFRCYRVGWTCSSSSSTSSRRDPRVPLIVGVRNLLQQRRQQSQQVGRRVRDDVDVVS